MIYFDIENNYYYGKTSYLKININTFILILFKYFKEKLFYFIFFFILKNYINI